MPENSFHLHEFYDRCWWMWGFKPQQLQPQCQLHGHHWKLWMLLLIRLYRRWFCMWWWVEWDVHLKFRFHTWFLRIFKTHFVQKSRVLCVMIAQQIMILYSDVDECLTSKDNCHTNASCSNSEGSYGCQCVPGFTGDGFTCSSNKYNKVPWFQHHTDLFFSRYWWMYRFKP